MTAPSAAWPLHTLVSSLARSGWGDLADRAEAGLRTVLQALADVLPHGSAAGLSTATQLADVCGLSERWVRKCLARLEDLGLITWRRGYINAGTPVPGRFTVVKTRLVELITAARDANPISKRQDRRRAELADRIAKAGSADLHARKRKRTPKRRGSSRPELSSSLPFRREVTGHGVTDLSSPQPPERPPVMSDYADRRPRPSRITPAEDVSRWADRAREALRRGRPRPAEQPTLDENGSKQ